jgi:hypothetical protein
MNNLLELVVMAIDALICLRGKKPPRLTVDLVDALASLRGMVLRQETAPFENDEAALAWIRSVVQWDLLSALVDMTMGRNGALGGPLFVQGFVEAVHTAIALDNGGKIDARKKVQVAIEIGQAQGLFQILRGQQFEDLFTQTLEEFVEQEQDG